MNVFCDRELHGQRRRLGDTVEAHLVDVVGLRTAGAERPDRVAVHLEQAEAVVRGAVADLLAGEATRTGTRAAASR